MSYSYREAANKILSKRKQLKPQRKPDNSKDTVKEIRSNFVNFLATGVPINLINLIIEWHELNIDELDPEHVATEVMAVHDGIEFFRKDIGNGKIPLEQQEEIDTGSGEMVVYYEAWAVKYENIFGMDLYFIPYKEMDKGFVCTVVDNKSVNRVATTVQDVKRKVLEERVADYLENAS